MITKASDALPDLEQCVLIHVPGGHNVLDQPGGSGAFDVLWDIAQRRKNHYRHQPPGHPGYFYESVGGGIYQAGEVTEWAPLPHRATTGIPDALWQQLLDGSLHCPYLKAVVAHFSGPTDPVAALAETLVALSADRAHFVRLATEASAAAPPPAMIVPTDERAQIVRYLERQAGHETSWGDRAIGNALAVHAEAIKRGEHLKGGVVSHVGQGVGDDGGEVGKPTDSVGDTRGRARGQETT